MAEQNYDVMISSKEYNELRTSKKNYAQLAEKNDNITKRLEDASLQLASVQKELAKTKLENSYLLQQIQAILNVQLVQVPNSLETGKSVSFEVLGESIFQPEKAQERKFNVEVQQLNKTYSSLLQKISDFVKQQQSKDEQIAELNKVISLRDQTIAKLQAISQQVGDKKVKEMIAYQKNRYEQQMTDIQAEKESLQKLLIQGEDELKLYKAENGDLQRQLKNSKSLLQKHKEQNTKLSGLLKDFSERTKYLEKEVQTLKKKSANSSPKIQTIIKIKAMIDDHIRQVEKNLKSIEGLSHDQITNLVRLQMKELVEYISKSIQNKK